MILIMHGSLADEGTYDNTNIGVVPFTSNLFTSFFKVCKVTHMLLAEGQTHVHRVNFKPNKYMFKEIEIL